MNILNQNVEHTIFGLGVVTEVKDHKIWVQFKESIGTKVFLYPEVFENVMKAIDQIVENNVLEELHIKQQQLELELREKEREAAEIEEKRLELVLAQKKRTRTTKKRS